MKVFFKLLSRKKYIKFQNKIAIKLSVNHIATVTVANSSTLDPLSFLVFLFPSAIFPSTLNPFKETWHLIYLCVPTQSIVKSKRWKCPLGKSTAFLFTALGLLLLLLHQDRYMSLSVSPFSALKICTHFSS